MITFAAGIAVGAAFAPFWIKGWNWGVTKVKSWLGAKDDDQAQSE